MTTDKQIAAITAPAFRADNAAMNLSLSVFIRFHPFLSVANLLFRLEDAINRISPTNPIYAALKTRQPAYSTTLIRFSLDPANWVCLGSFWL